jgi:hypothetical protein
MTLKSYRRVEGLAKKRPLALPPRRGACERFERTGDVTLESKAGQTLLLAVVSAAAGLLLMYLARDYGSIRSNEGAGFLLGAMLFLIGAAGVAIRERRRVVLDEERRQIVLEITRSLGGNQRIVISFERVAGIGVALQGDRSSGSRYYDLIVQTRRGEEIHLFGGCAFEGRMDRVRMDELRRRFEQAVS